MTTRWGPWHAIHIVPFPSDLDEQPEVFVMHPDCQMTVAAISGEVEYRCGIAAEIDAMGFDTILDGYDWLDTTEEMWFRVRHGIETIPGSPAWGSGFTEYEPTVETVRLGDTT